MANINLTELVPPIFYRAASYVRRRVLKTKIGRIHPFDAIPHDLEIRWLLDVGANKGDVTAAALRSYADAKAVCFEPVATTFGQLEATVSAFPGRTRLYKLALSNRTGDETINLTTFDGANSLSSQTKTHRRLNPHVQQIGTEKISLVRLDEIAVEFPTDEIDVLKIDVEGHELHVLEGGSGFISRHVDTMIIEISMMRDNSIGAQAVFPIFSILNDMGFVLTNVIDLYSAPSEEIQLLQMDCVFRHRRKIRST